MLAKKLKLLIIEDSEHDADLLVHQLQKYEFDLEYHVIETLRQMKISLSENTYDLIISDCNLQGFDGTKALRLAKKHSPNLPFILISGSVSQEEETEILKLGANEVILKNNLNRLPFAVRRVLHESAAIKKLKRTTRNLKQSLKQKEVLLAEIHQRVKNNLAVISGLLELESINTADRKSLAILTNSIMRIKSMALIHEKLYATRDMSNIVFQAFVDELLATIEEKYTPGNSIQINKDIDHVQLNINLAIPTALVLNELVSNAFKHAFPRQKDGTITVRLKNNHDEITLSVEDDGIGLPKHFDMNDQSSVGFMLVNTLSLQLEADWTVDTNPGTRFTFVFQNKEKKGSGANIFPVLS